ncbi:hypothetical protein [Pontibacter ruber]|uniref:Capsule assembly protein Wzi n=1 Tax=Pontibacter ruber TaxID=1343895 RepID=A0ABW5CYM4_9BACT|nr:hypothetical protein [Pontibacter ruber]
MRKVSYLTLMLCLLLSFRSLQAQDTTTYKLRLSLSLLDLPQQTDLPQRYPSMQQSTELSNNLYDLGFWGINGLGNKLVKVDHTSSTKGRAFLNKSVKYLLSLGFVKYGSELPIPLGVWAHEEYHRVVLGVNGVSSKNGNWLPNRWDGTVYGVTDAELTNLKANNLNGLLYSYVAGVQSENLSTQTNLLNDFYNKRSFYKNALYLYNAYYTWDYLKFSASPASDDVKQDVPQHENADPRERDYAGSDLTAWAYDMFNPDLPYTSRDPFPGGEGVNRRVGYSDLTEEAQDFLQKQKRLSLINFANPAILFVNRIRISPELSFIFFGQYVPTHFGNDVALQLPVKYKQYNVLLGLHRYQNRQHTYPGLNLALADLPLGTQGRWHTSVALQGWKQPAQQSFYDESSKLGGAAELSMKYSLGSHFASFVTVAGKTEGWQLGSPYLKDNLSLRAGISFDVLE